MNNFSLVDINSQEFENRVFEILTKNKIVDNSRFIRLPDGWIRDVDNTLEWGPSSDGYLNYAQAETYCKNKGGRLPTLKELHTLVDYSKHEPALDESFFPDTKHSYYWTSTRTAWRTDALWCVSFCNGCVYYFNEDRTNYVRPVRPCKC